MKTEIQKCCECNANQAYCVGLCVECYGKEYGATLSQFKEVKPSEGVGAKIVELESKLNLAQSHVLAKDRELQAIRNSEKPLLEFIEEQKKQIILSDKNACDFAHYVLGKVEEWQKSDEGNKKLDLVSIYTEYKGLPLSTPSKEHSISDGEIEVQAKILIRYEEQKKINEHDADNKIWYWINGAKWYRDLPPTPSLEGSKQLSEISDDDAIIKIKHFTKDKQKFNK